MAGRRKQVRGLLTALITPFDEKGRVDTDRLAKLVRFQVSAGAEGIFSCGSTGLGPMLTLDERKAVAATVVDTVAGKIPVVVQVGCADTGSAVELAKHAEKAGADAVASLTPYYYKPGDDAVRKHFEAISKSASLPLFAYNIPQFTGNNLAPPMVAGLAKAGTIAGVKDSSRDFLQLLDIIASVPDDFVVMNGTEEYGLFAISSGADGLVSGGASALPELFKSLVSSERRGDFTAALAAQEKVEKFKALVKQGPISAYYSILRARGVECGDPRRPFLPLQKSDANRIESELKSLRLF